MADLLGVSRRPGGLVSLRSFVTSVLSSLAHSYPCPTDDIPWVVDQLSKLVRPTCFITRSRCRIRAASMSMRPAQR